MWVRNAHDDWWPVADGIVAVEVRVVIATAMIVVVAVTIGVVSPAWIARADKYRSGKVAATIAVAITITGTVGAAYRGGIGVVGAGAERECCHRSERGSFPMAKMFLHAR